MKERIQWIYEAKGIGIFAFDFILIHDGIYSFKAVINTTFVYSTISGCNRIWIVSCSCNIINVLRHLLMISRLVSLICLRLLRSAMSIYLCDSTLKRSFSMASSKAERLFICVMASVNASSLYILLRVFCIKFSLIT